MAFYFLPTIVEFTRGVRSLFQIQGIQQDCVHRRLWGERERKKNCLGSKSVSGVSKGSTARGRLKACGCIHYLDSGGFV